MRRPFENRPLLARRLANSILAASLVLIALVAGAGLATANERGWQAPTAFQVAAPHVGDRVEYSVVRVGPRANASNAPAEYMSFEWESPRDSLDAEGRRHVVNRLASSLPWGQSRTPTPAADTNTESWAIRYDLDAATRETIAMTMGGDMRALYHALHVAGMPLGSGEVVSTLQMTMYLPPAAQAQAMPMFLCGLFNDLQGRDTDLRRPVKLGGDCLMVAVKPRLDNSSKGFAMPEGLHIVSKDAPWHAIREDEVAGRRAIVFESRGVYGERAYAWLASDLPYPLQVAFVAVNEDHPTDVFLLKEFRRGERPLATSSPSSDPVAKPLHVPRQPYGWDDSGRAHPFRLVDAYRYLTQDPMAPFTKVMVRPGAYVVSAAFHEHDDGAKTDRTWQILAYDGDEAVGVSLTQRERPPHGLSPLAGLLPPERTYLYNNSSAPQVAGGLPPPHLMPDTIASIESLEGLWRAYGGSALAPNQWGFTYSCGPNCTAASVMYTMGRLVIRYDANVITTMTGTATYDLNATTLLLPEYRMRDATLTAPMLMSMRMGSTWTVRPVATAPIMASAASVPNSEGGILWNIPSADATIKIGLFAVLVGLATWMWPYVRTLVVAPFFSRFSGPQLLEHPMRQEIVQRIEQAPGIHFMELARSTGLGHGALDHHLRLLTRANIVQAVDAGGYKCYVRPGVHDRRIVAGLPVLKSQGARAIVALVARRPGVRGRDIANEVGLTAATVTYHLRRLERSGMVRRDGPASAPSFFPTEFATAANAIAARSAVDVNA